jgi:hypothetical protein
MQCSERHERSVRNLISFSEFNHSYLLKSLMHCSAISVPSKPLTLDLMETGFRFSEGLDVIKTQPTLQKKKLQIHSRFANFVLFMFCFATPDSSVSGTRLLFLFYRHKIEENSVTYYSQIIYNNIWHTWMESHIQLNLDLRTQLARNGCTYCEKYSNQGMDSHRLTCEVVQLVNDFQKNRKNSTSP